LTAKARGLLFLQRLARIRIVYGLSMVRTDTVITLMLFLVGMLLVEC